MSVSFVFKNKLLFHITHIKNLPGILKKGIMCKNLIKSERIKHEDISHDNIQEVRALICIPNTSYTLHDYVPAFFGARPPMLYAVKAKGIAQKDIIYLLINWAVISKNTTWFTDGNARCPETQFYQGNDNLDKIDFEAVNAHYWGNKGDEYKRKKQAEVLVFKNVLLDDILGLVVYNINVKSTVQEMLEAQNVKRDIFIVPKFYYQ